MSGNYWAVLTKHGGFSTFATLAEARDYSNRTMIDYLEGLTCANDPAPTILEIKEVERLTFKPRSKRVVKRTGGAMSGLYTDHDCYRS